MKIRSRRMVGSLLAPVVLVCVSVGVMGGVGSGGGAEARDSAAVRVGYLEIVTPEVERTCDALGEVHGVRFGEPVAALGNARTAELRGGGRIGVRGPLREDEAPVVRPYVLVEDLDAAVRAAEAAGAEIALPRMELPGEGTCAIYILGGIEHGLWAE